MAKVRVAAERGMYRINGDLNKLYDIDDLAKFGIEPPPPGQTVEVEVTAKLVEPEFQAEVSGSLILLHRWNGQKVVVGRLARNLDGKLVLRRSPDIAWSDIATDAFGRIIVE